MGLCHSHLFRVATVCMRMLDYVSGIPYLLLALTPYFPQASFSLDAPFCDNSTVHVATCCLFVLPDALLSFVPCNGFYGGALCLCRVIGSVAEECFRMPHAAA